MLFILINSILKLSFRKWWQSVVFGGICATFIIGICPLATLQSKTQLSDFLNNMSVMQDTAVLITLESVICFTFCFASLSGRKKGKGWTRLLDVYPGLLVFPVLFYILTQLIFSMPGTSFTVISYFLGMIVFAGFSLLTLLVKRLYPEIEFRLEIHFLVSLLICIIGLITTVDGTVTYSAVGETINIKALVYSFGLFAVLFLSGYVWNRLKWRIKSRKSIFN
ncbi:hypothetical protein FACS1894201_00830 [Bacteroidia bacterium]|nr:hypothetical protein FACS1894201_00830 [Bacteroidia bacterium]